MIIDNIFFGKKEYFIILNEPTNQSDHLFFRQEFLIKNSIDINNLFHFSVVKKNSDRILMEIFFEMIDKSLISLPTTTYGGFNFSEDIKFELFELCFNAILSYIKKLMIDKVVIKAPPVLHSPTVHSFQNNLLVRNQFTISSEDINYSINLSNPPHEFISKLNYSSKKKLKQSTNLNIVFNKLTVDHFDQAYTLLELNRSTKNRSLSISRPKLYDLIISFPENFLIFGLFDHLSNLIASSISISINSDILYVLYWGDHPDYRDTSPIINLAMNIFNYALKKNYTIMDIGTSTIGSQPDYGLMNFKSNIGFIPHSKSTWSLYI